MNELDDDDRKYNGMPLEQLCGSSGRRDQVVALARWVGETYGDSVPLVFRVSMALRCLKCTSWSNDAAKMTFQRQALQMIDDAKRQRAAAADDDDDAAPGALLAAAPSDHLAPPPPRPRWPTSVVRPRTGPSETAVPMAVDEKCTLQLMLLGEPGDGKPATIPLRPDGVTTIGRNGEVNLALEHSLCAAITSSPGMAPTIVAYITGVCIGGSKFVCTAERVPLKIGDEITFNESYDVSPLTYVLVPTGDGVAEKMSLEGSSGATARACVWRVGLSGGAV